DRWRRRESAQRVRLGTRRSERQVAAALAGQTPQELQQLVAPIVWVQGDRSDKLLQLLRGLPRGRTLWLLAGLACGGVRAGLRRKLHKQTAEQGDQNPF